MLSSKIIKDTSRDIHVGKAKYLGKKALISVRWKLITKMPEMFNF